MSNTTTAPPLTPDVATFIMNVVVQESVEGLLYGAEFLLTLCTGYLLIQQGLWGSTVRCCLLAAIIVLITTSTIIFACDLVFYLVQIKSLGFADYDPVPAFSRSNIVLIILCRLSYVLGDFIVVWRAWILFRGRHFARLLLVACMVFTLGSIIANGAITIRAGLTGSISSISVIVSSAALLVTNLTATSLIAYRAWYYRKYIKDHIGTASGSKRVEKILILLVESGSIFCVLWLVALLGSIGLLNEVAETYFTSVLPHAETIYPNIIILLTTLQKTHCDTTLQGQSVSQPLQFAPAQQSLMTSRSNYVRNVALGAEIAPNKTHAIQKEGRAEGMEIV